MNTNNQLPYPPAEFNQTAATLSKFKVEAHTPSYHNSGLSNICYRLMIKAISAPLNSTAQNFEPIMDGTGTINPIEWKFLAKEPQKKKVLVDNRFLKVIIFHWAPGDETEIHGHPKGSCLIKVLKGKVQELRYNPNDQKFLTEKIYGPQESGYIDDSLALHSVKNPFNKPAVTLHAYLKYR